MNPSPPAITAIKAQVGMLAGTWANTDAQIVDALNAPSVPNPVTSAPSVPKPITAQSLFACLDAATLAKLWPPPDELTKAIGSGDVAALALWVGYMQSASLITSAQVTALQNALAATQPDPAWAAEISWAQLHLGRPVDLQDLALVRAS